MSGECLDQQYDQVAISSFFACERTYDKLIHAALKIIAVKFECVILTLEWLKYASDQIWTVRLKLIWVTSYSNLKAYTQAILLNRRLYTPFLQQFFAFDLGPKHCCIQICMKLEWFIIRNGFSWWIYIKCFHFDLRRKNCSVRFYTKIWKLIFYTVVPWGE